MSLNDLARLDWKVLAVACAALIAVLVFLASILKRARKIDLPFMHVFLSTVTPKRRVKR